MTEVLPAKPKRFVRKYTADQITEAIELYADGLHQPAIARKLGIPQQTIAGWLVNSQCNTPKIQAIQSRIKDSVSKVVAKLTDKASSEVNQLLVNSLRVGNMMLLKAEVAALSCNGRKHVGALVQASTAAKTGIAIARQALGLNDTTESVIVRVDLVGKVNQSEPIDITPACGVSTPTLALTQSTSDTTSDNKQ